MKLSWDERKRQSNLSKHGFDFTKAGVVLNSRYRLDITVIRNGEARIQSLSYVMNCLAVLTVVHLDRQGVTRIISFRPASQLESKDYYEWLAQEDD